MKALPSTAAATGGPATAAATLIRPDRRTRPSVLPGPELAHQAGRAGPVLEVHHIAARPVRTESLRVMMLLAVSVAVSCPGRDLGQRSSSKTTWSGFSAEPAYAEPS